MDITTVIPAEIKASKTVMAPAFEGIAYWSEPAGAKPRDGRVWSGRKVLVARLISWQEVSSTVKAP